MDRRLTRKPPRGGASASKSKLPPLVGNSLFDAEVNKNLLTHFFEQSLLTHEPGNSTFLKLSCSSTTISSSILENCNMHVVFFQGYYLKLSNPYTLQQVLPAKLLFTIFTHTLPLLLQIHFIIKTCSHERLQAKYQ